MSNAVSITLRVLPLVAVSLLLRGAQPVSAPRAFAQDASNSSSALRCYERASEGMRLGEGSAYLLCRGARSVGPAQCYESGTHRTNLLQPQLFSLCRCARSEAPVDCYEKAKRKTFLLDSQIIDLCSAIVADNLWPNCTPVGGAESCVRRRRVSTAKRPRWSNADLHVKRTRPTHGAQSRWRS